MFWLFTSVPGYWIAGLMPPLPSPVRIRGHHLICLSFFHGNGHSPAFAKSVLRALGELDENPALIIKENDDLCAHCATQVTDEKLCTGDDCAPCRLDALALELLDVRVGETIEFAQIRRRLPDGIATWRERACVTCRDREDCSSVMDLLYPDSAI